MPDPRPSPPRLVIVAAVARNGVIGRDNALPWRLKTDLARFRRLTWGKPMIMGRRSWDSIGRPLPGREAIVLTRQADIRPDGALVVGSWDEALDTARARAAAIGADEIIAFGGTAVFRMALPQVDAMHLTIVEAEPPGDVVFPPYDEEAFDEVAREAHPAGPDDEFAFSFVDLERRAASA